MEKKLTMWTTAVANGYLQANNRNDGDANNSGTAGAIDSVGSIRPCGSFGLTALLLGVPEKERFVDIAIPLCWHQLDGVN